MQIRPLSLFLTFTAYCWNVVVVAAASEQSYNISLDEGTVYSKPPVPILIEIGQKFVIYCQFNSLSANTDDLIWAFNEHENPVKQSASVQHLDAGMKVILKSFSLADVGTYECRSASGKVRGSHRVLLLARCLSSSGSCRNGGKCALDPNGSPYCMCPEYFKGPRCEYISDSAVTAPPTKYVTVLVIFLSAVLLAAVALGLIAICLKNVKKYIARAKKATSVDVVKYACEVNSEACLDPLVEKDNPIERNASPLRFQVFPRNLQDTAATANVSSVEDGTRCSKKQYL